MIFQQIELICWLPRSVVSINFLIKYLNFHLYLQYKPIDFRNNSKTHWIRIEIVPILCWTQLNKSHALSFHSIFNQYTINDKLQKYFPRSNVSHTAQSCCMQLKIIIMMMFHPACHCHRGDIQKRIATRKNSNKTTEKHFYRLKSLCQKFSKTMRIMRGEYEFHSNLVHNKKKYEKVKTKQQTLLCATIFRRHNLKMYVLKQYNRKHTEYWSMCMHLHTSRKLFSKWAIKDTVDPDICSLNCSFLPYSLCLVAFAQVMHDNSFKHAKRHFSSRCKRKTDRSNEHNRNIFEL